MKYYSNTINLLFNSKGKNNINLIILQYKLNNIGETK
jgi:hypothetical protein